MAVTLPVLRNLYKKSSDMPLVIKGCALKSYLNCGVRASEVRVVPVGTEGSA
ncbi:hypothetical protein C7967_107200 [Thalassospira sp. 11-3]|jgi:hypothetical protein|nr:hypothetical protein KO164_2149 [Thalassospira sp. KO164]PXX30204.1 hypothetical protein C7967_107200 [Thalassospira sp. 11-3]SEE30950.1 hypothetical protein SAMN04515623_2162 [Thalassospira permensis]